MTLLLIGCSSEHRPVDDDDDDVVSDDDSTNEDPFDEIGAPPPGEWAGAITITAPAAGVAEDVGEVLAGLRDGHDPQLYDLLLEEGRCRYFQLINGFCDPFCAWDEACNADSVCEPYPLSISSGTLSVEGLVIPLEIESVSEYLPGMYWQTDLPADLFEAGAAVVAHSTGGEFPPLFLEAHGVERIESDIGHDGLTLEEGTTATISWTPGPDPDAQVELLINGPTSQTHGGPLTDIILCAGTDSGEFTIPALMVDEFLQRTEMLDCVMQMGVTCPDSLLSRTSRVGAEMEFGLAMLEVKSSATFRINNLYSDRR